MADHTGSDRTSDHVPILCISLDAAWEGLAGGDERISGVKIDVQGMELTVLEGMEGIIQRWRPLLIIEFHRGVARAPIARLLKASHYVNWGAGSKGISPQWADDESYAFGPLETSRQ